MSIPSPDSTARRHSPGGHVANDRDQVSPVRTGDVVISTARESDVYLVEPISSGYDATPAALHLVVGLDAAAGAAQELVAMGGRIFLRLPDDDGESVIEGG